MENVGLCIFYQPAELIHENTPTPPEPTARPTQCNTSLAGLRPGTIVTYVGAVRDPSVLSCEAILLWEPCISRI